MNRFDNINRLCDTNAWIQLVVWFCVLQKSNIYSLMKLFIFVHISLVHVTVRFSSLAHICVTRPQRVNMILHIKCKYFLCNNSFREFILDSNSYSSICNSWLHFMVIFVKTASGNDLFYGTISSIVEHWSPSCINELTPKYFTPRI